MNIAYVDATPREYDKAPHTRRTMYFHYLLSLNDEGNIVGGRYLGGNRIDMLWTPLKPIQGGEKGNEAGNPHLNVKEVLAIWRLGTRGCAVQVVGYSTRRKKTGFPIRGWQPRRKTNLKLSP